MSNTVRLISTSHVGDSDGTRFADCPPTGHLFTSTINQLVIRGGGHVLSLKVYYGWNDPGYVLHGTTAGGIQCKLTFDATEYITGIEGLSNDLTVGQLTFVTNKRRLGPYGGTSGEPFKWGTTNPSDACRMRLLAFSGTSDKFLLGLQATFAEYGESPARYEPTSVELGPQTSHSTFGRYLTSTTATLLVGAENVKFNAHEAILCKLPFFQAALLGNFREASEKRISMPDDDPANISALIEFLYTGNYTYTYDPQFISIPEGSTRPEADIIEGLYHAAVYVLASKYDAADLATQAMKNFGGVSRALDSVNALRLWKALYTKGLLQLPKHSKEVELWREGQGMTKWVKELFAEHGEEMDETVLECPQLAGDLLRIVTAG